MAATLPSAPSVAAATVPKTRQSSYKTQTDPDFAARKVADQKRKGGKEEIYLGSEERDRL